MIEKEISVEIKLKALYDLQQVKSEIDKIRTLRGELPLEVQDLEDDIAGLETRISNFSTEIKEVEQKLMERKNAIEESKALIKRYEEQQNNVRNNREFDSLSKEMEFQGLEITLAEKRIKEDQITIKSKSEMIEQAIEQLTDKKAALADKQKELDDIIADTRSDEDHLKVKAAEIEKLIEPRLLTAFKRIRRNAHNGLALVSVQRDACGGCFNKIPPQRQVDIKLHKKVLVCEYCGRILVDPEMGQEIVAE